MIRKATEADVPAIVAMARKFYATTSYAEFAPMDDGAVAALVRQLMDSVMLVHETDGRIDGMVGLVVAPFMFNNAVKAAYEVVWWVDPQARGGIAGKALLEAVEPACKALGCSIVVMVHLHNSPPQAAALYERMSYHHTESSYTKRIP